jgi:prepilin-type N-terminal cleavage/methylation domain-containing protein
MHRGFTLAELVISLTILAVCCAAALPRVSSALHWIAVDRAGREIATALAVGRHLAVAGGCRVRIGVAADSLRLDRWDGRAWRPVRRWPGPSVYGVALVASNPAVVYGPAGLGWGVSNTKLALRRGSQMGTITVSRLGRVKRW